MRYDKVATHHLPWTSVALSLSLATLILSSVTGILVGSAVSFIDLKSSPPEGGPTGDITILDEPDGNICTKVMTQQRISN